MKVSQLYSQDFFQFQSKSKPIFEECKTSIESPKSSRHIFKPNNTSRTRITKKEYKLLPSNLFDELDSETLSDSSSSISTQPQSPISSSPLSSSSTTTHPLLLIPTSEILHKIQSHQGSLILQRLIQSFPKDQTDQILLKLTPILINIMISHYGNYFFQQLLQLLTKTQKIFILNFIQQNFLFICTNKSGTYSIQALIEAMESTEEEILLEQMLTPILAQLCGNENGHHIILKLIILLPEERRSYINTFILKNLPNISCNKYGHLCIIKFMTTNTNLNLRVEFITQITTHFLCLIQNPFGCSIVLFLIEKYGIRYRSIIFSEMLKNMCYFAGESNISLPQIEQVLFYLNKYDKSKFENMIWELFRDKELTLGMMNYQNGNRIIYNLLQYASYEQINFFKSTYMTVKN